MTIKLAKYVPPQVKNPGLGIIGRKNANMYFDYELENGKIVSPAYGFNRKVYFKLNGRWYVEF